MIDEIRKNYSLIKILIILLIIASGSYVLSLTWIAISKFLNLFVILISAWLLSFILEPIVGKIQRVLKTSKLIATITAYILISILIAVMNIVYIPLITSQILTIANTMPKYLKSAPPIVAALNKSVTDQIGNFVTLIPSFAQFLFLAFITLILSFYFIADRENINKEFFKLAPKQWHDVLRFTQKVINDTFVSFIRVQLFFGISSGILTWIVLRIFNIDFAASIAFISGVFAFIPLIGPFFALVPPVLIALFTDPIKALIIGAILLIAQQITFNIIGPKLLGKAFRLHPAIVLVSFLVGLQFAGALGAVFAIPLLGISAVMLRRFGHYFLALKDKKLNKI